VADGPALVNGTAGVVVAVGERVFSVMGFTVARGAHRRRRRAPDPERLADVDLTVLDY
jgi:RNA polymerase sigma-70 factor (ECF subfamily)